MQTVKAGCVLVDTINKKVGLIYRSKHKDYSFPKGHLEGNESFQECAIRETAEETKRDCRIVENIEPNVQTYITPRGEDCVCYTYVATDIGPSLNASTDTHDLVWVDIDKVTEVLTYDSLKEVWNTLKENVEKLCK